jgi:diamine N-acetyltransferase
MSKDAVWPPAAKRLTLESGMTFTFRPLSGSDAKTLADYFNALSPQTRVYFQPHALDAATAKTICGQLDHDTMLRMVAIAKRGESEQIIAYFVVPMSVGEHECARLQASGVRVDQAVACSFAPSVVNGFQSRGVASAIMPELLDILRRAGRRQVVLLGGTQANNLRAVNFYTKFKFEVVGEFEHPPGIQNYDMVLLLG